MKTLAIIGAGKGLGLSLAKRFGKEGLSCPNGGKYRCRNVGLAQLCCQSSY